MGARDKRGHDEEHDQSHRKRDTSSCAFSSSIRRRGPPSRNRPTTWRRSRNPQRLCVARNQGGDRLSGRLRRLQRIPDHRSAERAQRPAPHDGDAGDRAEDLLGGAERLRRGDLVEHVRAGRRRRAARGRDPGDRAARAGDARRHHARGSRRHHGAAGAARALYVAALAHPRPRPLRERHQADRRSTAPTSRSARRRSSASRSRPSGAWWRRPEPRSSCRWAAP